MNKEDYLRLLEKVIDDIPAYITAIASFITATSLSKQTKKRKPKPHKHK
ncbi:hypothetical protein [Streptococcus agalactiae]|uniref:Uncharacterized protein n=1 Tax=Streptococcus agalactiae TaxID=1311 RepID=A0AB74H380_STRAG|nr:hypothetical protein [Streptococcus agalactiae]CZT38846.1 hypothetical protein SA111_00730 [Streptococcus agalactiae]CZT39157.1 hypothetical protein SA111_01042 [Streptococcus agalactiae]SUN28219.1 Uncharacterised protein [Streptococcus agalactiae]